MGLMNMRHSKRRGTTVSTANLINEWSMDGAETNTTDLIGQWSMDGALRDVDDRFGSPANAHAIVPAERARVCGTAYDVPILVKRPEDETWRALGVNEDAVADEADFAERLLRY